MRKIILTVAGLLLLTSAGVGYAVKANADPSNGAYPATVLESNSDINLEEMQSEVAGLTHFIEYTVLEDLADLADHSVQVVEDNSRKRVILLKNHKGHPRYKSVYVKSTERLKVIDFHEGLVFDQVLRQSVDNSVALPNPKERDYEVIEDQANLKRFTEYETLSKYVDMNELNARIVEDNDEKRVLLLKDNQGQPKFKSVYVKSTKRLKLIDFTGGLVFNDILGKTEQRSQPVGKKEREKKVPSTPAPKVETPKSATPEVEEPKKITPKVEEKKVVQEKETLKTAPAPVPKVEEVQKVAPTPAPTGVSSFAEYSTIAKHVDVKNFKVQVVEDNQGKRVILLKDGNGKPQYKSIYIKGQKRLKIINLRGGLVFNGRI